jgi:signal recognition particle receptor subunit beta
LAVALQPEAEAGSTDAHPDASPLPPTLDVVLRHVTLGDSAVPLGTALLPAWDLGGGDSLRALWRHYYRDAGGVVFVLDACAGPEGLAAGRDLLMRAVLGEDDLRGLPVLVCANHQDGVGAMGPGEVAAALGLPADAASTVPPPVVAPSAPGSGSQGLGGHPGAQVQGREVRVQGTVATTGAGLREGLVWLLGAVARAQGGPP